MPIFDQGYQHWKGTLSGRGWRWWVIARQGLFGQLKSWRVRGLLFLAWSPALALVTAVCLWGLFEQGTETALKVVQPIVPKGISSDPHAYRQAVWTIAYSYFFKFELVFIMLLVTLVGPNLISSDLRFNALPLYLSRPLTRLDYFLGKLGVIATLVAAVAIAPAVMAYVLGVCFSLDFGVIRDTWRLLPASIAYGAIIVVSAGPLMLAVSSLSRRSLYVGIAWFGLWIVSSMVANALGGIYYASTFQRLVREDNAKTRVETPPTNPDEPSSDPETKDQTKGRKQEIQRVPLHERVDQAIAEMAPTNWRPLCSYTANLERLGEALLNTDAAWVKIGEAFEAPRAVLKPLLGNKMSETDSEPAAGTRRLANRLAPQYPWVWSAGVLAGLLGISLWILSTRVKSLDRLK